jgi:hypothetical protein
MTIERFARDSRNAVIAKVKDGRVFSEEPDLSSRYYQMRLALQSELKMSAHWNSQILLKLPRGYPMLVALPQSGSSVIVLFKDDSSMNIPLAAAPRCLRPPSVWLRFSAESLRTLGSLAYLTKRLMVRSRRPTCCPSDIVSAIWKSNRIICKRRLWNHSLKTSFAAWGASFRIA